MSKSCSNIVVKRHPLYFFVQVIQKEKVNRETYGYVNMEANLVPSILKGPNTAGQLKVSQGIIFSSLTSLSFCAVRSKDVHITLLEKKC